MSSLAYWNSYCKVTRMRKGAGLKIDGGMLLADPLAYTDERRLHAALTQLRANAPVSWVEVDGYRPFWAITKHADIMDIERNNTLFTNWPRPVLTTAEGDAIQASMGVRTLIH